ncbi:hypothetical protein C5167_019130 [Papaver somniferum]|uniref:THH1/TOM1/TOM3 domain-containing protein n=1 Tax=Papaver somniferum TaxID=3469 RepID=A0A4Y7IP81_PAPSO|nr:hypothetical protein C5167_019130 [Papaver somniferum]
MTRLPFNISTAMDFTAPASDWWNQVNESTQWQDGIFFSLCGAYALVSLVALIQLIRIEVRVPEYGWTTQKVFHLMNFIVNGVRAIVFGFHKQVFVFKIKVFTLMLVEFPGLLFFSTYTLLARSLPADKLRIVYISVNGGVYLIQVCLWIYLWINDNDVAESVGKIFMAGVVLLPILGIEVLNFTYLVFGVTHCCARLFFMLRRFPIESKGRRKKLHEVALSAFDKDASLDVLDHPVLNLVYYLLAEILPSALVLFILRKLPPKRVSAQYHPIR